MLTERETLEGTAALVLSGVGVGTVASASLLAFLPELGQLDEKEIASLAGLAPITQTAASIAAGGTSPRAGPRCVGRCTWRWWRACGAMPGRARCTTA